VPRRRERTAEAEARSADRIRLTTAGLFGGTLLLIPADLALQFSTLSYFPRGLSTLPLANNHTWAFLYSAALAAGVLLVRPRTGREGLFRTGMEPFVAQGALWLALWVAMVAIRFAGGEAAPGVPGAVKVVLAVLVLLGMTVGAVLAGLLLRDSRRGGLLMTGQLLPWAWGVAFLTTWGAVT
jgi:hypothetical protein